MEKPITLDLKNRTQETKDLEAAIAELCSLCLAKNCHSRGSMAFIHNEGCSDATYYSHGRYFQGGMAITPGIKYHAGSVVTVTGRATIKNTGEGPFPEPFIPAQVPYHLNDDLLRQIRNRS